MFEINWWTTGEIKVNLKCLNDSKVKPTQWALTGYTQTTPKKS